ncbi:MAG: NAD-dependent epimerase/dehydratase family protein [Cyclobacteriaceae bacterium]|nr:NAD-dependent epimerase/dehydratase family protein [Cyclobacteriaceae bacterium]
MKAIIAGATGLVGSHLLKQLAEDQDYDEIWVLTRRPLNSKQKKIKEVLADFEDLESSLQHVKADHVFCCLGTTMKKAKSKEAFKKVDLEYPRELARIMLSRKAQKFLLVSALGASTGSFIFYNRVKGEVEKEIRHLGYPGLVIFRPSLLLGDREEQRTGEDIAKKTYKYLDKLFIGPLKKYRGIHAATVAACMIKMAKKSHIGTWILESDQIQECRG